MVRSLGSPVLFCLLKGTFATQQPSPPAMKALQQCVRGLLALHAPPRAAFQLPLLASAQQHHLQLHTSVPAAMPDVCVPPLGESISEGSIAAVVMAVGDRVAVDQTVAQLETDKVGGP